MSIRCKNCNNRALFKSTSGSIQCRIDGPIVFDANNRCVGRCHDCRAEIELPFSLDKSLLQDGPRLVIEKIIKPLKNG